jgi:predicted acyltransferase
MADLQSRYLSLDVFRGMTICFMIIVNSPGLDVAYGPLVHAKWHGFTPTDLVFPSFLFAVGNAMAFSMYKYEAQGEGVFWTKTLKRTVLIFLLGFLLYWFPFVQESEGGEMTLKPFAETRILGVLQRIALCYFFASIVLHYGSKKFAVWFSAVALLAYWILAYTFGDFTDPYSLEGNAGLYFDLYVLGPKHLYHGEGIAFDPEGLLSTLPSIVNVIAGFIAGDYIRRKGNSYESISKMMIVGCGLILLALTWDMAFPINKKLWTSSFVLLTVGLDLMIISILIYIIEIYRQTRWTYFFLAFGRNPLFIYLVSEILLITLYMISVSDTNFVGWISRDVFGTYASPKNASFLFAFLLMMTCWVVAYFLDKKKIYIRV